MATKKPTTKTNTRSACPAHSGIEATLNFLEQRINAVENKLDRFQWFMILTLVGACGSLLLLILQTVGKWTA